MRRSGSSSCMLRPRASLTDTELAAAPPSITMVNTRRLPRYSAERYYVLSELEMHSNSVKFLCDYDDDGTYAESLGEADRGGRPPRNVVLYLLWRPDGGGGGDGGDGKGKFGSAREFAEGPILNALRRLISLRGGDTSPLDREEGSGAAVNGNGGLPPPQALPSGGSGESAGGGGGASFGGNSGYGWPSSPPVSPMSPSFEKKKALRSSLRNSSSFGNIAVLPTLEEPTGGSAPSTPSNADSADEKKDGAESSHVHSNKPERDGDDGSRPDADVAGMMRPASPPPSKPMPASSAPPSSPGGNASPLRPVSSFSLRRSASSLFREQEEAARDRTRTRVYIAVDRLSGPPPPPECEGEAAKEGKETTTRPREGAVNDRGERHVPEEEGGDKERGIKEGEQEGKDENDDKVDPRRLRHHNDEVRLAESLAKYVASSRRLRPIVDGICVGVASCEVRSAATPALEAALGAAAHGAPERRRGARYMRLPWVRMRHKHNRGDKQMDSSKASTGLGDESDAGAEGVDPSKSAVGIAASHPDDLVGLDPKSEPDASQGVLQSITVAEWGGNGDASCFARRAMTYWRERHGLPPAPEDEGKENGDSNGAVSGRSRKNHRRRGGAKSRGIEDSDELATAMVVAFLVCVISYFWSIFGEQVRAMVMEAKNT